MTKVNRAETKRPPRVLVLICVVFAALAVAYALTTDLKGGPDETAHFIYVRSRMNKKPKRLPSEYFKDHFWVSTSGMNGTPAVKFCKEVLGVDRIMFAADYPHEPLPLEVKRMDAEIYSEEEMNKIYHVNAEKLFRL